MTNEQASRYARWEEKYGEIDFLALHKTMLLLKELMQEVQKLEGQRDVAVKGQEEIQQIYAEVKASRESAEYRRDLYQSNYRGWEIWIDFTWETRDGVRMVIPFMWRAFKIDSDLPHLCAASNCSQRTYRRDETDLRVIREIEIEGLDRVVWGIDLIESSLSKGKR